MDNGLWQPKLVRQRNIYIQHYPKTRKMVRNIEKIVGTKIMVKNTGLKKYIQEKCYIDIKGHYVLMLTKILLLKIRLTSLILIILQIYFKRYDCFPNKLNKFYG